MFIYQTCLDLQSGVKIKGGPYGRPYVFPPVMLVTSCFPCTQVTFLLKNTDHFSNFASLINWTSCLYILYICMYVASSARGPKRETHSARTVISMAPQQNKWSLQGATALVTGGTGGIGWTTHFSSSLLFDFLMSQPAGWLYTISVRWSSSSDIFHSNLVSCFDDAYDVHNDRHAVVEELAGLGASVYTCTFAEAELQECLDKWKAKGLQVAGSVCDVSSRAGREKLMDDVSRFFNSKLNILVSCLINIVYIYNMMRVWLYIHPDARVLGFYAKHACSGCSSLANIICAFARESVRGKQRRNNYFEAYGQLHGRGFRVHDEHQSRVGLPREPTSAPATHGLRIRERGVPILCRWRYVGRGRIALRNHQRYTVINQDLWIRVFVSKRLPKTENVPTPK